MRVKLLYLIVSVCIVMMLSGCWSQKELNELAIVVGMGIDRVDDKYLVSVQVVNPSEISSKEGATGKTPVVVFEERGDSIFEALRRVTTTSPRKLYFSHLRVLIYGEAAARHGIEESIDFLTRDHELRTDFYVTIARDGKAKDILKILTVLDKIPVNKMFYSLESSQEFWAPTIAMDLNDLLSDIESVGINPKLTGIMLLNGDSEKGQKIENTQQTENFVKLVFEEVGVFNKDQLIGWLSESESRGLNYALNKVKSTITELDCEDEGIVDIEITKSHSKLKTLLKEDEIRGVITVKAEGNIGEMQCRELDLSEPKTIDILEERTEKSIASKIQEAIDRSQQDFELDYFGFGNALYRKHPKYWRTIEENWNEEYKNIPIDVNVDVKIRQTGTTKNRPHTN